MEIMHRTDILKKERQYRKLLWQTVLIFLAALVMFFLIPNLAVRIPAEGTRYPLKYSPTLGGYILVGIAFFVAGISLTWTMLKRKDYKEAERQSKQQFSE